jgi:hypothetical protein
MFQFVTPEIANHEVVMRIVITGRSATTARAGPLARPPVPLASRLLASIGAA